MSGEPAPIGDPWSWLLGRTATGGWRHAPFRAIDPGQGQDPSLEPRVEVVRRLIAYPSRAFATLVAAVAASDRDPQHPIQWVCHRSSGEAPARPYWISFLRAKEPRGRRFFVSLELFDRERLGLWFLSGFADSAVPFSSRAPFPEQPRVALPRFELGDETIETLPAARWVQLAFEDALAQFTPVPEPVLAVGGAVRPGAFVDESVVLDTAAAAAVIASEKARAAKTGALLGAGLNDAATLDPREAPPSLRSARARLVTCVSGRKPEIIPLARLNTVVGRDPRCDLVLDERSISSEHARIGFRDGVPTIEDLGSKNGTRVGTSVVRRGQGPVVLEVETYVALGQVGCLFVRDAEETQPPGTKAPPRQRARLEELVARGRIARDLADRASSEARVRGLTPAEVLIAEGAITPEEWTATPRPSSGVGCVVLIFLLILFGATAGCHSMAFPPLYEQEIDEGVPFREGEREVTWDDDIALRPIFDVRTSKKDDQTEVHWIFPLGLYERKGEDKRVHLYPFYLHDVRRDPDGFKHDTTVCFPPGLFAGTHPVHGDFVYVFPFGGTMYGLFGKDEIYGVLFPLFAHTVDRGVSANHVLFPLIAWWSGGDEKATQTGFRFLPFYGHQEKTTADGVKVFDRTTILWPFFTTVYEGKNSRNPFTSIFLFPFWGRTRSDWRDDDTILWPLFRHVHDKQNKYVEWRAPFPFFVYGSEDGTEGATPHTRFDVWPLFGVRTRGESYFRQFVLWPFERYERQETEEYTDRRFWFVPFVYTMSRTGKNPNQPWSERKTRVWPLVRYERTKEGDVEVRAFAPILWDDPKLNFETILDPLYRIFRYASRHDGSHEMQLLLGLFSTRTKADGASRWDVLGGLVGHGTDAKGDGKMRLFWWLDL